MKIVVAKFTFRSLSVGPIQNCGTPSVHVILREGKLAIARHQGVRADQVSLNERSPGAKSFHHSTLTAFYSPLYFFGRHSAAKGGHPDNGLVTSSLDQ